MTEDENMFKILEYHPQCDMWRIYCLSQVVLYGLSYFQGELITVGGSNIDGFVTIVYSYDCPDEKWEERIQAMPTARCTSNVICTDVAIIVCGGAVLDDSQEPVPCQLVEVYNSVTSQWHTTAQLPHPYAASSPVVICDHCFLAGEAADGDSGGQKITYAKIKDLVEVKVREEKSRNSLSNHKLWKELPETPLVGSAAVSFNGSLLTLGGDDREGDVMNEVHAFVPKTNSWTGLLSGALPEARGGSSAVTLSDSMVIVLGGNGPDRENTATVFTGMIIAGAED